MFPPEIRAGIFFLENLPGFSVLCEIAQQISSWVFQESLEKILKKFSDFFKFFAWVFEEVSPDIYLISQRIPSKFSRIFSYSFKGIFRTNSKESFRRFLGFFVEVSTELSSGISLQILAKTPGIIAWKFLAWNVPQEFCYFFSNPSSVFYSDRFIQLFFSYYS